MTCFGRDDSSVDVPITALLKLTVAVLLVLACILQGCNSVQKQRMENDGLVVAASPVQIPAAAGRDTYNLMRRQPLTIPVSPFISVHYLYKHTIFSSSHLVDLAVVPTLKPGSNPNNVGLYDVSRFPFSLRGCFDEANVMKRTYEYTAVSAVLVGYVYGGIYYISRFGLFSHNTIYYSLTPYIAGAVIWSADKALSESD